MDVRSKRVYEQMSTEDGTRVLVDRYWPRGVTREDAHVDRWLKDIAPSPDLIHWFGHQPERWPEFKRRYWDELDRVESRSSLAWLAAQAAAGTVTLVYSARDTEHNNAVALAEYLKTSSPG